MPAEEDHTKFTSLADELGLTDDDPKEGPVRTSFIESAMKRKGYKPSVKWDEPDPPEPKTGKKEGGDFFSRGGGQYEN